jgi:hypothetical protein
VCAAELGLEGTLRVGLIVLELTQAALERSLHGIHLALALAHRELEPMLLVAQARHFIAIRHASIIDTSRGCGIRANAGSRLAVRRIVRQVTIVTPARGRAG